MLSWLQKLFGHNQLILAMIGVATIYSPKLSRLNAIIDQHEVLADYLHKLEADHMVMSTDLHKYVNSTRLSMLSLHLLIQQGC